MIKNIDRQRKIDRELEKPLELRDKYADKGKIDRKMLERKREREGMLGISKYITSMCGSYKSSLRQLELTIVTAECANSWPQPLWFTYCSNHNMVAFLL